MKKLKKLALSTFLILVAHTAFAGWQEDTDRRNCEMSVPQGPRGYTARQTEALMACRGIKMSRDSHQSGSSQSMSMPAPQPSVITSCDGTGCWDNLGQHYSNAGGGTYIRQDGGVCQGGGGQMNCN